MVNVVLPVTFDREYERRDGLMNARLHDVVEFIHRQQCTAGQAVLLRMPDHDSVLVGLRQQKSLPLQDRPCAVQRAPRRNRTGNFLFSQQPQRFAGVVRDHRSLVQQGAVEVKNDEFHRASLYRGSVMLRVRGRCSLPEFPMAGPPGRTTAGRSSTAPGN